MQAGYNYRITKVPSNWDIPYGVAMIIKREDIHIDPALQANFRELVIARRQGPEAISVFEGTVPDLRQMRGGIVESGLSPE